MLEERYLQVTYSLLGVAAGWLVAIAMMALATWSDSLELALWALMVVAGVAVVSVWAILCRSRARLVEVIDMRLRMHEQVCSDVTRIPTPR